jgi:hypothetical protein
LGLLTLVAQRLSGGSFFASYVLFAFRTDDLFFGDKSNGFVVQAPVQFVANVSRSPVGTTVKGQMEILALVEVAEMTAVTGVLAEDVGYSLARHHGENSGSLVPNHIYDF